MAFVKKFASDGVTVCATIHSPSPFAFSLFDKVLMLVRGEIVYFGDRGKNLVKLPLKQVTRAVSVRLIMDI